MTLEYNRSGRFLFGTALEFATARRMRQPRPPTRPGGIPQHPPSSVTMRGIISLQVAWVRISRVLAGYMARLEAAATARLTRLYPWPADGRSVLAAKPGAPVRVLFLRSAAIGDSLVALGALRAIASARPGSVIDIVGAAELRDAVVGLPYIGEVFEVRRRARWTYFLAAAAVLRRKAYDVVVDAHSSTDRIFLHTALLFATSRARVRIGRSARDEGHALTHLVRQMTADEHWVDYMFTLVGPVLSDAVPLDRAPRLALSTAERERGEERWLTAPGSGPRVLINVSTGHAWRRWEDDRYAAVAAHIRDHWPSAQIGVIGHGREQVAMSIAAAEGGVHFRTTFREMMSIVASADLVITPDTSVSHVAAAFDRTIVSLHPVETEPWRPYRASGRQLYSSSRLTLNFIQPEAVTAAVDEFLGNLPARP